LKDRLTAKEYQSWKRYELVNGPFGKERDDYNAANIVKAIFELGNIIIAVNTGKAASEHPMLEDCLLRFKRIFNETSIENREIDNVKALLRRFGK
jgi:hypothetical protein